MHILTFEDPPALVVRFQVPVLSFFNGQLIIVELCDSKGKLQAFICRKLVVGRVESVTLADHDRGINVVVKLDHLRPHVEEDAYYGKHGDHTTCPRLLVLLAVR